MLELGVLIASAVVNALLGLIVYTKNPKSATNKLFSLLTGSFIIWSVVNYLSVHPILLPQLILIRLVLFFASFLCLVAYLTFSIFPDYSAEGSSRTRRIAVLYTLFVMILTLTPAVFKGLRYGVNHNASPMPNFGIVFFIGLVILLLGGGIWSLISKYHYASGRRKLQLRFMLAGLVGTFGLIFLTNFLFVVIFHNSSLVPLGAAYTLIFSSAAAYTIVKHRLFDIRRATARGLAYMLTVGLVGLLYAGAVFGASSLFLGLNQFDKKVQLVNTVLALLLAFSFAKIKRFFDKLSNRLFYKDAYEPQVFLDQLNRTLIAKSDLQSMLEHSMAVIQNNLKADSCTFVIYKTAHKPMRIINGADKKFDEAAVQRLRHSLACISSKIVVTDYLESSQEKLLQELSDEGVGAVLRLASRTGTSYAAGGIGKVILGPKRSGDPYTEQDVQILSLITNELVIAIENVLRFEEIQDFSNTLQQKVATATKQLRNTNDRLKQMDETKDDFIGMASHQLRTPLTSVKGYLSLVLEGDAGNITDTQRKLLGQAFISSQRMVYLIADLLNVSRLKTGKFVIAPTPVNLAELVDEEIKQLVETAGSRELKLEYHKPAAFPAVPLDETKTRQVIMNFVDNAIYYTPAGGHIKVTLADHPHSIELRVTDDGIGVPKHEQHHLFTKFYRAKNAQRTRPDGTGLGLFMAKKVVVAQGGAIIFNSTEGKGSVFGFTFPKNLAAATVAPTASTPPVTAGAAH